MDIKSLPMNNKSKQRIQNLDINKQRFIEELYKQYNEVTAYAYTQQILKLQEIEDLFEKPIQNFTQEDIESMFMSLSSSSANALSSSCSIYNKYYQFLLDNNIATGINKFEFISQSYLRNMTNKIKTDYKFCSEEEIKVIVELLFNYRDKAILMLCWEGLDHEEIANLEISDINFENKTIKTYKNKTYYNVLPETLKWCESAQNENVYTINNNVFSDSRVVTKNLESTNKIIRSTKKTIDNKVTRNTIYLVFKMLKSVPQYRLKEVTGLNYCYMIQLINHTSLAKSHNFYMIAKESINNPNFNEKEAVRKVFQSQQVSMIQQYLFYKEHVFNRNIFKNKKE